ncbi:MAG: tRNA adenosine(34) deaminase TadA [Zetaproteobacteria bacterium]|nr:tRNA adenosine(34) deaminase TadA [Zetaproteobacteria bacterium]
MPTSDDYMRQALHAAQQAESLGEVPVGAVLLLDNGQIFTGHNIPIGSHDPTAHAEMVVLRQACTALENYRLPANSTLYVTLEPCIMCVGALIHARLSHLVYAADEPKTGAIHSLYQLGSDARLNHQMHIQSGLLADESGQLLRRFFKQRRKKRGNHP